MDKDYDKLLKRIAANIKSIRRAKGLTQEQMIDLGFNYRYFQKLESGTYSFNLFTIHRLAKAFKVKIQDFFK